MSNAELSEHHSPAALSPNTAWRRFLASVVTLSDREREVFGLLAEGRSNREISTKLHITERTAKAHVARIMTKLNVESRLQAGLVGFAWKVIVHNGQGLALPAPPRQVELDGPPSIVAPRSPEDTMIAAPLLSGHAGETK